MPLVYTDRDRIHVGEDFSIALQRTLRIPDDGRAYPLPPALGKFPVRTAESFAKRVPAAWLVGVHFLIPMHRMEAMWLGFYGSVSHAKAVKVGVGNVNAVSGEPWDDVLRASPQDYLVCPYQRWLDGINAGEGKIRQFVAVPLGIGVTVEAQVSRYERVGGIQVLVVQPAGDFSLDSRFTYTATAARSRDAPTELGVGAGGWIKQRIYPDPFGTDVWDRNKRSWCWIHLLSAEEYADLTGEQPPPPVIDAETYARYGLPWFEVYDEMRGDVPAPPALSQLESVQEKTTAEDRRGDAAHLSPEDLKIWPIPFRGKRGGKKHQ